MRNGGTKTAKAFTFMGLIICALLIIILLKYIEVFPALGVALKGLQAFIFGILFACIMSPMLNGFERKLAEKLSTPENPRKKLVRGIAVTLSVSIIVFVIIAVTILVIPQVGVTVEKIIPSFRNMVNGFNDWVKGLSNREVWQERIYPFVKDVTNYFTKWILSNFGANTELFAVVTTGLVSAVSIIMNMFIGLILSVYLLLSKEKLFAQIEKLCMAIFKKKWGGMVMDVIDEGARIFSGFFGAKVLEAIIMGVICFAGMMIMQLPYATLVSVLVGIANIIPFFGPYIGTILGAALIVLVNPWQALYFIIFMIILVQFDGNFMGPKILGHSTGLSAMWVIFAILFFGGTFGIIGMFVGVPVFAWIYYIVKRICENILEKQGLPTSTDEYIEKRKEEAKAEAEAQNAGNQDE